MTNTNTNDRAFPVLDSNGSWQRGLTKREYFAALAMKGLIAGKWACPDNVPADPHTIAGQAIAYADALINELNKKDGNR